MDNEFEEETNKEAVNIIIMLPHYAIPRDLGTQELGWSNKRHKDHHRSFEHKLP